MAHITTENAYKKFMREGTYSEVLSLADDINLRIWSRGMSEKDRKFVVECYRRLLAIGDELYQARQHMTNSASAQEG